MNLQNKVAVITGSGMGIGLEIARSFARGGAKIVVTDIKAELAESAAQELRAAGAEAIGIECDVSKSDAVERMLRWAAETFGGIDIVVNNAGILFSTPFEDISEDEWDLVQSVDLKGVFLVIQKSLPYLKRSVSPRIINISSVAGRMGSYNSGMSYVAAKGGVLSLTRGLARRLAVHGITVNAVCPGTIESDMITQWSKEAIEGLVKNIPLGRLGKPRDIAAAVTFLASEDAGFITGVSLDVNGGMYMA